MATLPSFPLASEDLFQSTLNMFSCLNLGLKRTIRGWIRYMRAWWLVGFAMQGGCTARSNWSCGRETEVEETYKCGYETISPWKVIDLYFQYICNIRVLNTDTESAMGSCYNFKWDKNAHCPWASFPPCPTLFIGVVLRIWPYHIEWYFALLRRVTKSILHAVLCCAPCHLSQKKE